MQRRNTIRYIRWACKLGFLILFLIPFQYVPSSLYWQSPSTGVTSIFSPGARPFFYVPMVESPCSIWFNGWSNPSPAGAWLVEPLGAIQALITSKVDIALLMPTIISFCIVAVIIILLGATFCSWACPIGTLVDSFDRFIERFLPKLEAKRAKNKVRSLQKGSHSSSCALCPVARALTKNEVAATGLVAGTVVGSAVIGFNIFCFVCPIGIITRGLFHLKGTTYVSKTYLTTNVINPFFIEFLIFPVIAVLVSLRERRFWCNKLCPVGVIIGGIASLNPFIKIKLNQQKCIMNGCPEGCEDSKIGYCGACRKEDDRKCEKVCPADIKLVDNASMHRCTKCMECYLACGHDAIEIHAVGKPDIFRLRGIFKKLKTRLRKPKPAENNPPRK
ncbi:MAG: 4Fe-4S binding protein [Candidatus Bathyarchaeota archaeon]|nr:4Fe-4S binding protein [Candidatus Bathyarchaeota archaeon]